MFVNYECVWSPLDLELRGNLYLPGFVSIQHFEAHLVDKCPQMMVAKHDDYKKLNCSR